MNLTTGHWMMSFHSMRNTPKLSYICVIYKACLNPQREFSLYWYEYTFRSL